MRTNKKIHNEIVTMREALRLFSSRDGVVYLVDLEDLMIEPVEESTMTLGDIKAGYESGGIVFIHRSMEVNE
jgi:hypothetical protein